MNPDSTVVVSHANGYIQYRLNLESDGTVRVVRLTESLDLTGKEEKCIGTYANTAEAWSTIGKLVGWIK